MLFDLLTRVIALSGPLSITVTQIAYGALAIFFVYGIAKGKYPEIGRDTYLKLFLFLMLALLLTTLCAEDVKRSLFKNYKQTLLPLTFLVGRYICKRSRLDGVFFWTLVAGAIATIWGIVRLYLYGPADGGIVYRIAGTFSSSIRFGNMMALITILGTSVLLLKLYRSKRERNIYIIFSAISFAGLAASNTRGAWIAFVVGIVVLLLCAFRIRGVVLSAIVCASAVLLAYSIPELRERFAESFANFGDRTTSLGWRFVLWDESWQVFKDNPITGVGFGNLSEYYLKALKELYPDGLSVAHAHNNVLQILAEHGLIGFAAIVALYFKLAFDQIKGVITKNRFAITGFVLLATSMVEGITEYALFNSELCMMFWLLCGGLLAAQKDETDITTDNSQAYNLGGVRGS